MEKTNPSKLIIKILGKIFNAIIWVAIILITFILITTTISKKTDIFGHRIYVIMSGSMEPTIMTGDAVITKNVDNPNVGDIIAFENGDIITIHRIIGVEEHANQKLYQTKGDNNNTVDKELVQKEQIKGKAQFILPNIGGIILFIQNKALYLVFGILVLIVFIIARRLIISGKEKNK